MENALLYTFSTIAQALGGAFALLSAFVLYRFQLLGKSMHADAFAISDLWLGPTKRQHYNKLIASGDYAGVVTVADEQYNYAQGKPDGASIPLAWDEPRQRLRANIGLRASISGKFKCSAVTTGIVMIVSVALIPLAHPIHCMLWLAWPVAILGVVGFALCLFQYWSLIKAAIYDT